MDPLEAHDHLWVKRVDQAIIVLKLAFDALGGDKRLEISQHLCLVGDDSAGALQAERADQVACLYPRQLWHVAEVAAAGAEAEILLLDDHNIQFRPRPLEVESRGHPSKPAANHNDVTRLVA